MFRLVIILLLLPPLAFSQRQPADADLLRAMVNDTPKGERTPYKIYYETGEVKAEGFYYLEYDVSGKIKKGYLDHWGNPVDHLLDSLNVEYYPSGATARSVQYSKGKLDGMYIEWHENGQMAVRCKYVNNFREGLWTEWYPDGKMKYEILMRGGLQDGVEQQWHETGKLRAIVPYRDGKREGDATYYYPSGMKLMDAFFDDDRESGTQTHYYENGDKKAVYSFIKGSSFLEFYWDEKHQVTVEDGFGVMTGYDPIKNERFEVTYENGKLNGPAKYYYVSGELKREGNYQNDQEQGAWTFYQRDGSVVDAAEFNKGMRIEDGKANPTRAGNSTLPPPLKKKPPK